MTKPAWIWMALSALAAFSACSPQQSAISCERSDECFEGEVCRAGLCRTIDEVQEDTGRDEGEDAQDLDSGDTDDLDAEPDADVDSGPKNVSIRLSWSHPQWAVEMGAGPDLDLHYCSKLAYVFTGEAQDDCVYWRRRVTVFTLTDGDEREHVTVELLSDSLTPEATEDLEHLELRETLTHIAVHYYATADFEQLFDEPLRARVQIFLDGEEWDVVETELKLKDEVWYAARIEWGSDGSPTLLPGLACEAGDSCSENGHYQGFPVDIF